MGGDDEGLETGCGDATVNGGMCDVDLGNDVMVFLGHAVVV